jgi:hypothetical protein
MKQTTTSIIRTLIFIMLICKFNNIYATNHKDSLHLPYFVKDGNVCVLHSSVTDHYIERELSEYIEQKLPIIRYDCTSFRFFIQMKINKKGQAKRLKLLNRKSFKNNMVAWEDVKKIIRNIDFHPAIRRKPINYDLKFYLRLVFY